MNTAIIPVASKRVKLAGRIVGATSQSHSLYKCYREERVHPAPFVLPARLHRAGINRTLTIANASQIEAAYDQAKVVMIALHNIQLYPNGEPVRHEEHTFLRIIEIASHFLWTIFRQGSDFDMALERWSDI